jgi:hypothetical protein
VDVTDPIHRDRHSDSRDRLESFDDFAQRAWRNVEAHGGWILSRGRGDRARAHWGTFVPTKLCRPGGRDAGSSHGRRGGESRAEHE